MSKFAVSASWNRCRQLLAVWLLCAAAGLAQAQTVDAGDQADPPDRVARLSYMAGDLGFLPSGAQDWSDASINRPLTTGDRLSSGQNARAELEFGGGTLSVDGLTDLGLLDLDDQLAQIELTRGTLRLTVRNLDEGQSYEIDTPTVALVIDRPGTFRVDVGDSDTRVTAFAGVATVYGENDAQRTINPDRSYRFTDSALNVVTITDVGGGDAFDNWAAERGRRYAQSGSSQYVSDDVVGYQDLDQYGDWQDTSEYGAVWFPNQVAVDWAPYRNGRWTYVAPWGWTWVDDSPWGFAPYHYGRWAYMGSRWGWVPGPRGVRAVYAPALVAFVGGGSWSVGIGGAPVGWFPLGPRDIYNPWYRCGRDCYTRVNLRNLHDRRGYDRRRDIADHYERFRRGQPGRGDHYANRGAPRGFTAVPGNSFAGGRHVQRNLLRVDPRKLANAPVLPRGAARLRPVGGEPPARAAHVRNLPVGGFDREVVARRAPPVRALGVHRAGPANRVAGPARGAAMPSRVRVLNARDNHDRVARPLPVDSRRVADNKAPPPATPPRQLPRAPRITTAAQPLDPQAPVRRADTGELRSARFVRPENRTPSARPVRQPSPAADARLGAPRSTAATLPPVQRVQRAGAISATTPPPPPSARQPSVAVPSPRTYPRPTTPPARSADVSRYRQPAAAPRDLVRSSVRETPRAMPQQRTQVSQPRPQLQPRPQPQPRPQMPSRSEPPQRSQPQPHYQPPQRSAPAPRVQPMSSPSRSASRPASRAPAPQAGDKHDRKH